MNKIGIIGNTNFKAQPIVSKPCEIHENCNKKGGCIDLTNVYTQENIIDILREAKTYHEPIYPCKYSISYNQKSETLVINNTNMTNDTTEINKDGTVRHCGSWHNKEIAKEQKYADIVNDAIERIEVMNNK